MSVIICKNCKKEDEHHAKGLCYSCYRKFSWQPKKFICKRCGKEKKYHGKGLCAGCYTSVYHIETIKAFNRRKIFNIDKNIYLKLTKHCVICGFSDIVDLHHLDHDKTNNSTDNLIGICPNHHRMLHHRDFQHEIFEELNKKGFKTPKTYEKDEIFKS